MTPADNDDREKRSWREIDAMRDKSHQRAGAGPSRGTRPIERTQAYRAYKTELGKLFDGGGLPEALKSKLESAGVGLVDNAKRKKELTKALLDAHGSAAVRACLAQYREAYGEPDREDVLAKLLETDDEAMVLTALTAAAKLQSAGSLKRSASLKARIKTAEMTMDAAKITALAKEILAAW